MRIHCTSVAESNRKDEIQRKIQELFPECKVVVIPNRYTTKEGKKEVQEYAKSYYEKNKESILAKKKEREARKKAELKKQKDNEYKIKVKQELKKLNTSQKNKKIKKIEIIGVRIDIWTHLMRGCIIELCTPI
jgi:hypothetical protein